MYDDVSIKVYRLEDSSVAELTIIYKIEEEFEEMGPNHIGVSFFRPSITLTTKSITARDWKTLSEFKPTKEELEVWDSDIQRAVECHYSGIKFNGDVA